MKLITATRLTACHSRVVCAAVNGAECSDNGVHFFKPELQDSGLEGLNMPEVVAEPRQKLHLVITNNTRGAVN